MKYLLSILFISSISFQSFCKNSALIIDGVVTEKGKKCDYAEIKAFEGNELIWSENTSPDGTFQLVIPQNKYIALVVEKDGFMSKYLIFDTRTEKLPNNVEPYECHIDLVKKEDLAGVDASRLEFPIAVVKYNKKMRSFSHDANYTANMIEDYNHLLNKSAINATRNKRNQY